MNIRHRVGRIHFKGFEEHLLALGEVTLDVWRALEVLYSEVVEALEITILALQIKQVEHIT